MSGAGGGNTVIKTSDPIVASFRIQTSVYGKPIPIVYGRTRLPANLLGYYDFQAIPHTETTSSGGGGGKGGGGGGVKQERTSYTYQAAVLLGLAEGPALSIGSAWAGKQRGALSDFGLQLFGGEVGQAPWGYLTTKHPDQAIGYSGIAYVANSAMQLSDNATLANHSFEVQGPFAVSTQVPDANPRDIITDFLSHPRYGAGFPAARIGDLTDFGNACAAAGILLSPAITEQRAAHEYLTRWARIGNAGIVWSEGRLKFIPYFDEAISGNGVTYTPNVTPVYELTDDDFLDAGDMPIKVTRKPAADAYNQVKVEYLDRGSDYNPAVLTASDDGDVDLRGARPAEPEQLYELTTPPAASTVARLLLQRHLAVRAQYEFQLGWRHCRLEPMDVVTLTHAPLGLDRYPVRIIEVEEDEDGGLTVRAEDFPQGSATALPAPTQTPQPYVLTTNVEPGDTHAPTIFEPPIALAGGLEVWVAASGGPNWGGADVWVSTDNLSYRKVGAITNPARHGVLSNTLPAGSDPDTTSTLAVDLTVSAGELTTASHAAADAHDTLLWVDGEVLAYGETLLSGTNRYNLRFLRRGLYGSPVAAHASGTQIVRLDGAVFRYHLPRDLVGHTLYLKLTSFNRFGQAGQSLADVAAYSYTPLGNRPAAPVALVTTGGLFQVALRWTFAGDQPAREMTEVWGATVNNRNQATLLTTLKTPADRWVHPGLAPGQDWYYWVRVQDNAGGLSDFYPPSPTAGVFGEASADPSPLMTQLKNAVGLEQLAADLAQPIASIDTIIPAALHDNALASLQLSLSDYDLTQRMQWQEEVTNATVGVDPVNGKIQLLATANVTTDVEQRLSQVEVVADAQKAALNSTVATLATVQGDLSSTQSQVSQLAGQVTTKASQVYVDDAVADATGQITVTAANAYSALADQAIREALDQFDSAGKQRDLQASVAAAQQDIQTHAGAIAAETAARTALVASVAANAAAIVDEKNARADADTAEATARQQLAARVSTVEGGIASNAAAIEAESSARADGDAAEAAARQLLAARVDATEDGVARNAADIASEAKARADDMGAAAGRMDSITAVAGASSKSLAEHALREALDQFDSAGKQRDLQVSVATALSSVEAAAVALRAEVASRAQLVATVAGVQAAVVEERSARSSADEAEAKARQQLEARVSTAEQGVANNAAALLEERTARADGDSANATALQQVRARLDTGDYAAVKEQASATASKVGGIEAKYVLMVDANGHTAAMELGSADGRSHVVFLADDFLIAQRDGSGPPKQAFIVGTVNGITTVGIDGALLVDGSVVARHIAAKSLTVDQIDTRGLDIRDADGNVVFSAGANLSVSRITGLGGLASKDVVGAADVSVTSLSAIVAYLGEIVGGRVRNSSGSNYINFDAVGSQAFIQCGNGFTLRADGGGEFARPLISAPNVVSSGRQSVDAYVSHGQSQVFTIATEAYFPSAWNSAPSDMYAASCTISSGWSENGGGTGLGRVELLVGDGLSAGGGGYVDGRVYIRYHYEHVGQPIRITELQWKVVRL